MAHKRHSMLVRSDARMMGAVTATKSGLKPDSEGWLRRIMTDHAAEAIARKHGGRKSTTLKGRRAISKPIDIPMIVETAAEKLAARIADMSDEQATRYLAHIA